MDGGEDSGRVFRKRFEMEQRMRVEHWCFGGKISMRGLGFGIWGFFKWGSGYPEFLEEREKHIPFHLFIVKIIIMAIIPINWKDCHFPIFIFIE